jgi:hypothetical protein
MSGCRSRFPCVASAARKRLFRSGQEKHRKGALRDATIGRGIWRILSSLPLPGRTWVDSRFADVIAFSAEALRIGSIHVPSSIVGRFQPSLNRISFRYQMSAAFPA